MRDYLCVVRQDERVDWYMLCAKDYVFIVVSAGPLEEIRKYIRTVVDRYGTAVELSTALHSMNYKPTEENLHSKMLEAVYEAQGHKYDSILYEVLDAPVILATNKKKSLIRRKFSTVKESTNTQENKRKTLKLPKKQKVTEKKTVLQLTKPKVAPKKKVTLTRKKLKPLGFTTE